MIDHLEAIYAQKCAYSPNWVINILLLLHAAPTVITVLMYVLSLAIPELFFFWLGNGLWLSSLLNDLLKILIQSPVPVAACSFGSLYCVNPASPYSVCKYNPPSALIAPYDCAGQPCDACIECGMPPLAAQQLLFLLTTFILYRQRWKINVPVKPLIVGALLVAASAYVHVYVQFNTGLQWLVGAALGVIFAALWHYLTYWFFLEWSEEFVQRYRFLQARGFRNTITPVSQRHKAEVEMDATRQSDTFFDYNLSEFGTQPLRNRIVKTN